MKELFVIDASGYLFRSYHAIKGMTNPKGESTNALFGFCRSVLKLIKDFRPEHLVAVFDGPNNAETRKALYPAYKSNREKAPDDLFQQFAWAKRFCSLMGIPFLTIEGVEADDTIASIVKWAAPRAEKIYLCSSDKDLCQCVDAQVAMLQTHKENLEIGPKEVEESYGIPPKKIPDWLAIVGDTSDNVPGIPGFGPKTATGLLQHFDSLEELLNHPEALQGKKRETLIAYSDQARLSKRLVLLDSSLEIPREEGFFSLKLPDKDALKEFYLEMRFLTLMREFEEKEGGQEEETSYLLVDDPSSLEELVNDLKREREIGFDTETTSLDPIRARLVGIGLCARPGKAWYLPCNGKLGKEALLKSLKALFEDPSIGFYAHHAKYDLHVLKNEGISVAKTSFDTLLASYLLNAHQRNHSLDSLALELFGKVKTPIKSLIGAGKKQIGMEEVPIEKVCAYCCEDVDYTARLKERLEKEIEERGLSKLFYELELPLLEVLVQMERRGVYVDAAELDEMSKELSLELSSLEESIYEEAGERVNLNSPKQLGELLFDKLGIRPPKKTATGYSTDADVLESLKEAYPIASKLLEYRGLQKLLSTYIKALPQQINPETGRIHCTFNQSGTATGRLASQDPNLQNIPVRTAVGRKIRAAFKPQEKNWSFLSADYSQIELRLLAHFSRDPELLRAFKEGLDIHRQTAANLLGIEPEAVTSDERRRAKAVNFGVIYGQGPFGLSRETGMSVKEASLFIERYFETFPTVKEYLSLSIERARREGKAVTLIGRERALPELHNRNPQIRAAAERLAVNTPLQGTAADLIKLAMLEVHRLLKERGWEESLVLQIHDELLFEAPDSWMEELESLVKGAMEGVWELSVPLVVDTHLGKNWQEC